MLLKEPLQKGKQAECATNYQTFDFTKSLILRLCHDVCKEVIDLHSSACPKQDWFECYRVSGAQSMRDKQGRTMWYQKEQYYIDSNFPVKKEKVKKENQDVGDEYMPDTKIRVQKNKENQENREARRSPRLLRKRNNPSTPLKQSPLKKKRANA